MPRKKTIASFTALITILGIAGVFSLLPIDSSAKAAGKNYVPGEVLVKYKNKVDLKTVIGRKLAHNSIRSVEGLKKMEDLKENNLSLVKITDGKSVENKIAELQKDSNVEYAEPNYYRRLFATTPDDSYFNELWGLNNTGQSVDGTSGTDDADIDAPEAWDIATTSGDVIIAVLDTGVLYTHPDLADNMWSTSTCYDATGTEITDGCPYHGWDFVGASSTNPIADNDPLDMDGHGTHCAGIIGAVGDNATGTVGVNWNTNLMAVKIFADDGNWTDVATEIKGIDFAKNNGAQIISASFGGAGYSTSEKEAIDAFPGLFVAAAGNNGTSSSSSGWDNDATTTHHIYPSDYTSPNIISVAATDQDDALASFSNYGTTSVDVGAPGTNILSTYLSDGYAYDSGTSMATPYVAGLAGLIWGNNPILQISQVKEIILKRGDVNASLTGKTVTGKRINAQKALEGQTPGDVVINEIMWAGSSGGAEDEWIELRNTTQDNINLDGWSIENASNSAAITIGSDVCSTTTVSANGYFLLSNFSATDTNSKLNVVPQCVIPGIDLNDDYSANGALTLRDAFGVGIDSTPDASTSAWPAGTSASPIASMVRNSLDPGPGNSTSSWYTATKQRGWDSSATDLGTPGTANTVPEIISSEVSTSSVKMVFDTDLLDDSTIWDFNNYRLESPNGTAIYLNYQNNWISSISDYPNAGQRTIFIFGLELTGDETYSLSVSGIRAQADEGLMAPYSITGTVVASTDPLITDISVGAAISGSALTFTGVRFGASAGDNAQIKFTPNQGGEVMVLPATSTDITSWSDTSITINVPSQACSEGTTGPLLPLSPGRYSVNIRNNDWKESQNIAFVIATDTASYITGQVKYNDNGMSDVNVFTYIPGQPSDVPGAQSTVNGWYALGPITRAGDYKVQAQAPGYISDEVGATISTSTPSIHTGADLTLNLLPGTISGTVAGSGTGYATTSVVVRAFDVNNKGIPPYEAMVNEDGTYQIGVSTSTFQVAPYLEGFAPTPESKTVTISDTTTTSSGNDFTMNQLTTYIQGTVSKGSGAEDVDLTTVWIEAFVPGSTGVPYGAQPNASGTYTIYVPPNSYEVRAMVPGYGITPSERTVDVASNASAVGIDFTVVAYTATLSGNVKNVLGQGISDAGVFAQKAGDEYSGAGTRTDSNGNYYLGLTSTGDYNVFIDPPFGSSYLRPDPTVVSVSAGSNSQDFTLSEATKVIRVRVMLNNATRTDAVVNAFKDGEPGWAETREQANGIYSLSVGGGNWKVMASPQNPDAGWAYMEEPYPVSFSDDTTVETSTLVTLNVTAADATVKGRVLSSDGSTPITRGGVDIRSQEGVGTNSPLSETGAFSVKVPAGTYNINIFCEDNTLSAPAAVSVPFTVASGATKDFGDIVMAVKQATISGRVTDANSSPIAGVRIHANKSEGQGWADTITNASGTYTLYVTDGFWEVMPDPMGAGDYVSTAPPRRVSVATNISTVSGIDFSLVSADATIKGRVVSGGGVVTSLFGFAFAHNSTANSGGPIENGTFSIKVPAGTYHVGVGFPPNTDYVLDSEQSVTVSSGQTANVDIPVSQATAHVVGTVKADDGTDLPEDVFVNIFAVNDKGAWRQTKTTVSGGEHYYSLSLTPGDWSIGYWINSSDYINHPPEDAAFTVTTGTTTKNIVVSKTSATISGTVYKPDGVTPLAYAFVFADSGMAGGTEKFRTGTKSASDGTYTLKVKAGTYKVGAGLPPEFSNYINPEMQTVTVATGGTATGTDLVFGSSNASISGTVSLGGSSHKAFVWAWSDKGGYSESFTMTGSYTLNVQDDDTWHVGAAFDGASTYYEASEVAVTLASGENSATQNLTLVSQGSKGTTQTVTFDATKMQVINLPDGAKIQIPAGALAASGNVTVSVAPTSQVARQGQARPIGLAYTITAVNGEGQTLTGPFNPEVVISLPYTPAQLSALGISTDDLKVNYWSTTNKMWQEVDSVVVDTTNKIISFSVDHFTYYGIFGSGDTTPPTFAGATSATAISTSEIDLGWTAATDDVDSSSDIIYNLYRSTGSGGEDYSSPTYTTAAGATSYQATGLSCGTTYYFVVRAEDTSGNEDANTTEVSTATENCPSGGGGGGGGDMTAPTISNIEVTTTATTSVITWQTNEASISWIVYGTSTGYGSEVKTINYVTSHSVTLTGLSASTTYHYQVKSKDSLGNVGSYTDKTFTTLAAAGTAKKGKKEEKVVEQPEEGKVERRLLGEMTANELKAKIAEIQTQIIQLRSRLVKLIQQKITEIQTQITLLKAQIKAKQKK